MMKQLPDGLKQNSTRVTEIASYFGLPVEIISLMEHSSLIRFRDREFIVDTDDLCLKRSMRCAA